MAFAAVSTFWGIPYLFIKVAVDDGVPPAFLAWVRVLMAAAVLLVLAWRVELLGGLRGRWPGLAVYALLGLRAPLPPSSSSPRWSLRSGPAGRRSSPTLRRSSPSRSALLSSVSGRGRGPSSAWC
jgi:hypothetical protein